MACADRGGGRGVGRFARELHVGEEREQRADALTDQRVVIREHDADHDSASFVGSHGHARAHNLWITVAAEGGAITLEAYDDGCGVTEVRAGQGLAGMRARLEELGGRLYIAVGDPARPFAVSAWLPTKDGAS